jgi:hypothetical protein
MPPLEDGDDDLVAPIEKNSSPPPSLVAEHLAVEAKRDVADDVEREDWCSDEYNEKCPPRDEAAFTSLLAEPVSRHGDFSDDHDALMGLCLPSAEKGYGMCCKGVRAAPAARSGDSFCKTRLCKMCEQNGSCLYAGRCDFAHGEEELRSARGAAVDVAPAASQAFSPAPASSLSTRRQVEEPERPSQLYKAWMCKNFEQMGSCKFDDK